ncbi:MAG: hypothetical protein ACYSX0_08305 [Planctomycetota bacterium]|jgi:hypothetical protein
MNRSFRIPGVLLAVLLVAPLGFGADTVKYAEIDGTVKSVQIVNVRHDNEKEFNAKALIAGRSRTLKLAARQIISFRRGDGDALNQWSRRLATGKRLMAAGQLSTRGTVPGAEEIFVKTAYTVEKGTPGQEKTEAVLPWHNMYAVYYLIETRIKIGTPQSLAEALKNVEEFKKRTENKKGRRIEWQVPFEKGTTRTEKVFCWGDTRLWPEVMLYRARILAKLQQGAEAAQAYDELLDHAKKNRLSPHLLVDAIIGKADIEAVGKASEQQEQIFATAGNTLSGLARSQPDVFGKGVLGRASNRALLRGADLLLDSASEGKHSFDLPLSRYRKLKEGQGASDPELYMGALAGMGVCLTEKGEGQTAYEALLEVVVRGNQYPSQMARALYYLGKAAPLYAKEIEAQGGKGGFLREEARRWQSDLRDRYPSSDWAKKVPAQ